MANEQRINQTVGRVQPLPMGEYNEQTVYKMLDMVSYQGSSYMCKHDNTQGQVPTNELYWMLISSRGDTPVKGIDYFTEEEIDEIIPHKVSDLNNDSGFITNAVNDLVNYYLKNEIYTKNEVNNLVSTIPKFKIEVVNTLPVEDISNATIYLLLSGEETQNLYTEYIYVNNTWEKLGTQALDLTGYATQTWVNAQISNFLTQTQIQSLIDTAVSNYYTKDEIDEILEDYAETEVVEELQNSVSENSKEINKLNNILIEKENIEVEDNSIELNNTVDGLKASVYRVNGFSNQKQYEGYNILNNTFNSTTDQGVKFTKNTDGSINAVGTATGNIFVNVGTASVKENQNYRITGCPNGGSASTYRLYTSNLGAAYDDGSGATFQANSNGNANVQIAIYNGVTINATFYPMIVDGTEEKPYEPYVRRTSKP